MKKISASSGFTLVEIAIVLTIIGILLGSGIIALNGILADVRYRTTQDRLRGISNALAIYAQQRHYLPCPANPALTPITGQTAGPCPTYTGGGASAIGIVPYAELGLTQEQVRDAYGNYVTYAVNPNFATETTVHTGAPQVKNVCRVNGIWFDTTASVNRNPRKAQFCCSVVNAQADLSILNAASGGASLTGTARNATADRGVLNSGTAATTTMNVLTQAPVFVLVSHGKNGFGAFRANGTNARFAGSATGRANEVENEDNDQTFIAAERSTTAGSYFDDILFWQNQDQLIGATGRDSCARP